MKRIIIFGCQKITIDIINFLKKKKDVEISLVATYDLPHDYALTGVNIQKYCKKNKIKSILSKKVDKNIETLISSIKPDLIISSYYRKILTKKIFSSARVACINIHPSLLPFYRGPIPTAWGLLNLEKNFGVTIHKIDSTIDGGDIYAQKKFVIKKNETGYQLYNRTMKLGFLLFKKNFDKILTNKIKPKKQKKGGSYYGNRNDFELINWKQSSEYIEALIRMRAQPFNVAQSTMYNRYFFINKVKILRRKYLIQKPGKILKVYKDYSFAVSTTNGSLLIKDYDVYPKFKNLREKNIFLKEGAIFNQ